MRSSPRPQLLSSIIALITMLALAIAHVSAQPSQQRLKPHDLVRLRLPGNAGDADDVLVQMRIDANGRVRAPYVGLVHVTGLSAAEASQRLLEAYQDANLIAEQEPAIELIASADQHSPRAGPAAKGDVFEVQVRGLPSTLQLRVDEQGKLPLPDLGEIEVLGKSEFDIAAEAERLYRDKELLDHPIVSVVRIKPSDESTTPPATVPAR